MNYQELRIELVNLYDNDFDEYQVEISKDQDNTILINKKTMFNGNGIGYSCIAEVKPNEINNMWVKGLSDTELKLIINFSKQTFSMMVDLPIKCSFKRSELRAAYERLIKDSNTRDIALNFKKWSELK